MKELLKIFSYFSDAFSFIWKKAETDDEKQIKTLSWVIFILVIFVIIWSSVVVIKKEKTIFSSRPQIVEVPYVPSKKSPTNLFENQFHTSVLSVLDPKATIPLIISKKVINEFFDGETVEIKSFGIYGIIHEKTLGPYGNVYTVRYKDNSHALHDIDCYVDELFRPTPGSLPPSALLN